MKDIFEKENTCLCKITFGSSPKERQEATGSIIKYNNNVFMVTAAHCLYNIHYNKYNENIRCTLFVDDFKMEYKLSKAFMHRKWVEERELAFDTAFAILDSFDNEHYFPYAVEPKFNMKSTLNYSIKGFPVKLLFSKKYPVTVSGKSISHEKYKHMIQGIICKDKNGLSGGPWLTDVGNKVVQNSNSSFSFKKNKNILWGPYWGKEIESVLHMASGLSNNLSTVIIKEYK